MEVENSDQFLFNSTRPRQPRVDFSKKAPWIIAGIAFLLSVLLLLWILSKLAAKNNPANPGDVGLSTSSIGNLSNWIVDEVDLDSDEIVKSEYLAFGNYYHPFSSPNEIKSKGVALPVNIKEQTANYYAFNREIVLDEDQINSINKNGYVVIDNLFSKETDDFYGVYKMLNSKSLPFLVTNDFLVYYYQNSLKSIFKQLESDIFYKEAWDFHKAMFDIANKRYRDRYAKVGLVNDSLLEAMRLEAAYFAVGLELLKVKPNQVVPDSRESVKVKEWLKDKFSAREAESYSFILPDYLKLDVNKEIDNINRGYRLDKLTRSPVMLYLRDYSDFAVPKDYLTNPRLNNFYLALQWSRNFFPLYYKSPECPDCALDKSDWIINQATAHLIARDMMVNQNLKNKFAKIYKVHSYFSGLRSELTYLDYHSSFVVLFGETKEKAEGQQDGLTIEQVFDTNNQDRDAQLNKLRDLLSSKTFDLAKGGYDRNTAQGRKSSGLRMIQESFWPTDYIYKQLVFDKVGQYTGEVRKIDKRIQIAPCQTRADHAIRCRGIGLDILNPVYNETIISDYFVKNTLFKDYNNQVPSIRRHFDGFNNEAWHHNFFWSNLHMAKMFLNSRKLDNYNYSKVPSWSDAVLNTALGSIVNSDLPYDYWRFFYQKERGLSSQELIKYNYVEPNLVLINELIANSKMVFDAFVKLGVVKENHQEFSELLSDLEGAKRLIVKERAGEDMDFNDWSFINNLVNKYYVAESGEKTKNLTFINPENSNRVYQNEQSIQGVKLLISVHYHQGRNLLLTGPVFNFKEKAR